MICSFDAQDSPLRELCHFCNRNTNKFVALQINSYFCKRNAYKRWTSSKWKRTYITYRLIVKDE